MRIVRLLGGVCSSVAAGVLAFSTRLEISLATALDFPNADNDVTGTLESGCGLEQTCVCVCMLVSNFDSWKT